MIRYLLLSSVIVTGCGSSSSSSSESKSNVSVDNYSSACHVLDPDKIDEDSILTPVPTYCSVSFTAPFTCEKTELIFTNEKKGITYTFLLSGISLSGESQYSVKFENPTEEANGDAARSNQSLSATCVE